MKQSILDQWAERIRNVEGFEELRKIRDDLHDAFLHDEEREADAIVWNDQLNDLHDQLIAQTVQLSETLLVSRGIGSSPVPFSFVLFGSGGRREQTLWSDQDNGIVFEHPAEEKKKETEEYLHILVGTILHGLHWLGYPPCEGNVLISNPQWRKDVPAWSEMLEGWMEEPNWEHLRYLLIFVDSRTLFGDDELLQNVRRQVYDYLSQNPKMIALLLQNTLHHKAALGPFGQIIRERYGENAGGFDLKYGVYIPIVNGVRLLALHHGIHATSTTARIDELKRQGKLEAHVAKQWLEAFSNILRYRSLTPYELNEGMYSSGGILSNHTLMQEEERRRLKRCLKTAIQLQKYVKKHMTR